MDKIVRDLLPTDPKRDQLDLPITITFEPFSKSELDKAVKSIKKATWQPEWKADFPKILSTDLIIL